jgi:hypothetical protein
LRSVAMETVDMTPEQVQALFEDGQGGYWFARWARPIVPVVFGVEDATLAMVKGAIEAVVALAGHRMAQTDPEMGANLIVFFVRDWDELLGVPDLQGLIGDIGPLVARLRAAKANQYRMFRFETNGGIRAAFVFLRMDAALAQLPADVLALGQMVQVMLLWGEAAFAHRAPLVAGPSGAAELRPEIATLLRVAYDPVLPDAADDASHALRLYARLGRD